MSEQRSYFFDNSFDNYFVAKLLPIVYISFYILIFEFTYKPYFVELLNIYCRTSLVN